MGNLAFPTGQTLHLGVKKKTVEWKSYKIAKAIESWCCSVVLASELQFFEKLRSSVFVETSDAAVFSRNFSCIFGLLLYVVGRDGNFSHYCIDSTQLSVCFHNGFL